MYPGKEDNYGYAAADASTHALLNSPGLGSQIPAEGYIDSNARPSQQKWIPRFILSWTAPWARQPSYTAMAAEDEEIDKEAVEGDFADDMSGDTLLDNTTRKKRKRSHELLHRAYRYAIMVFPSFLHSFMMEMERSRGTRRATDWLDGLRGVASLFVFFDHYLDGVHDGFENFGYGQGQNNGFFQLPFVKLIYAGSFMVAIFFIVSGYVLSHRCIVQMRSNKHDKIYTTLTSMTFRRGMRLFLPSVIVSYLTYLTVLLGLIKSQIPQQDWTVWRETKNYVRYLDEDLFKLWTWQISYRGFYSRQLWTIPLEFKCSLALFVVILMLARCRASIRIAIESLFITYLFYDKRWDVALFISGMLLAELNIMHGERQQRQQDLSENLDGGPLEIPSKPRWYTKLTKPCLCLTLLTGCFIGGYPHGDAPHTPGYSWLALLWFDRDWEWKWRFWLSVAAILVVLPLSFLPTAQRLFTTRIARYLGKISYGLYLVHDLLDRTLRTFLWQTFWKVLHFKGEANGNGEELAYDGGWIIGTIIYMPLAFWAADLFTRLVDGPTVRFARWVEGRCFAKMG
ncbi:MAG: hypothetical protein LQ340_005340 [Diploschistes diacapsis]|nr:MAG: hypothetical protein LQ340_005340 [Diploschistes diacapsis]